MEPLTPAEVDAIEERASKATEGPWTPFYLCDFVDGLEAMDITKPEQATGGFVFWVDPRHALAIAGTEDPELGEWIAPDNGVMVANKRTINRGYDLATGEPHEEEDLYLKPFDAAFIAASRSDVPRLCATIRNLRERLTETQADRERLLQDNERYEKTVTRLTSRGIEDMQHRIAELEAELKSLKEAIMCKKCGGPMFGYLTCDDCEH